MSQKNIAAKPEHTQTDVFEGMISVRSVLEGVCTGVSKRKIRQVLFAESHIKGSGKLLGFLKARSYVLGYTLETVPDGLISEYASGNSHGGVIMLTDKREFPEHFENVPEKGFYVLLDGIEDPYNLGYAIRSVYAAGADGVILPKHSPMVSAGIICRSSAGASELIPIINSDTAGAAALLQNNGYRLILADMDAPAPAHLSDLSKPLILAVGGEKRGFGKQLTALADLKVRLDYGREFPMALSAASAAAILSFEVTKQNPKEFS